MSDFIDEKVSQLTLESKEDDVAKADFPSIPPAITVPTHGILVVPSSTPPPSPAYREIRESREKKKVTFAADTIAKTEDTIASSITSHQYVRTIGHTQYKVELIFRGIHWTIIKRYRDFEAFHRKLIYGLPDEEMAIVPELPKKRWFEKQRWINRFDDSYSRNRRFALQDYLRMVIRTFPFQENRNAFVEFLEIPNEALNQEDRNLYNEYTAQRDREAALDVPNGEIRANSSLEGSSVVNNEDKPKELPEELHKEPLEEPIYHVEEDGQWREMEEEEEEEEEERAHSDCSSPVKQMVLAEGSDSDDEVAESEAS